MNLDRYESSKMGASGAINTANAIPTLVLNETFDTKATTDTRSSSNSASSGDPPTPDRRQQQPEQQHQQQDDAQQEAQAQAPPPALAELSTSPISSFDSADAAVAAATAPLEVASRVSLDPPEQRSVRPVVPVVTPPPPPPQVIVDQPATATEGRTDDAPTSQPTPPARRELGNFLEQQQHQQQQHRQIKVDRSDSPVSQLTGNSATWSHSQNKPDPPEQRRAKQEQQEMQHTISELGVLAGGGGAAAVAVVEEVTEHNEEPTEAEAAEGEVLYDEEAPSTPAAAPLPVAQATAISSAAVVVTPTARRATPPPRRQSSSPPRAADPFRSLSSNHSSNSTSGRRQSTGDVVVLSGSKKSGSFDDQELRPSLSSSSSSSKKKNKAALAAGAAAGAAGAGVLVYAATPKSQRTSFLSSRDMAAPSENFADEEEPYYSRGTSSRAVPPEGPKDVEALSNEAPPPGKSRNFSQSLDDDGGPNKNRDAPASSMVNHNFSGPKRGGIMGMSRPVFMAVSVLATGAAALGLYTGIRVPSLNSQVAKLEKQVNRLSNAVDLLEHENDRFNASNNQLNASIMFFDLQNEILNGTSIRLRKSVNDLGFTIDDLQNVTADLRVITTDFGVENDRLNATNQLLRTNVDDLQKTVTDLDARNQELSALESNLRGNVSTLTQLNRDLNGTYQAVVDVQVSLSQTAQSIANNLDELDNVTNWLNASVGSIATTLEESASKLRIAVDTNRALGLEGLHLNYWDAFHAWDCAMSALHFKQFQFPQRVINATDLTEILNDMNGNNGLVNNLCLDRDNYEAFLDWEYDITHPRMTTAEFTTGTNTYGQLALEYMFPNTAASTTGLTHQEWEAANYACENIERYQYPVPTTRV